MSTEARARLQANLVNRNISEVAFTMLRDGTVSNFTVHDLSGYNAPYSLYDSSVRQYYAPWLQARALRHPLVRLNSSVNAEPAQLPPALRSARLPPLAAARGNRLIGDCRA